LHPAVVAQVGWDIDLSDSTLKDDAHIVLTSVLDQLLYCFQNQEEGDRGKDPLTNAMASLLAALINDEIEAASSSLDSSALVQDIAISSSHRAESSCMRQEENNKRSKLHLRGGVKICYLFHGRGVRVQPSEEPSR
jgi:hypothetical protein